MMNSIVIGIHGDMVHCVAGGRLFIHVLYCINFHVKYTIAVIIAARIKPIFLD
jgi:hypothetical protein